MLVIASTAAISQQTFTIHSQSIVDERWRTLMSGVLNTVMGFGWAGPDHRTLGLHRHLLHSRRFDPVDGGRLLPRCAPTV
jgi:hypothetical protein